MAGYPRKHSLSKAIELILCDNEEEDIESKGNLEPQSSRPLASETGKSVANKSNLSSKGNSAIEQETKESGSEEELHISSDEEEGANDIYSTKKTSKLLHQKRYEKITI